MHKIRNRLAVLIKKAQIRQVFLGGMVNLPRKAQSFVLFVALVFHLGGSSEAHLLRGRGGIIRRRAGRAQEKREDQG